MYLYTKSDLSNNIDEKRQKRKEQQQQQQLQAQQQQQQQQPPPGPGTSGPGLRPCAPPNVGTVMPGASKPVGTVPPTLRSHSPSMGQLGTLPTMAIQQHNRMQFPQQQQSQQQQQAQQQQQQQVQAQQQIQQQQQQQGLLVGPPGPSPNGQSTSNPNMVPNPGLSPFGQPQMSQANLTTTTASNNATTSQFPTSNGTATGLPNSSPIQNQHQFPDLMKVRLAQAQAQAAQQQQQQQQQQQNQQQQQPTSTPSQVGTPATSIPQTPSPFSGMQPGTQQPQQQSQQQPNQQFPTRPLSASTPNDNGIATPQTIPPPASSGPSPTGGMSVTTTTNGPQSTTSTPNTPLVPSLMTPNQTVSSASNQTPPHSGPTPSPAGLASLGKGMTSQERAALNTPRSTSMSSQMAAITAALDRDNSPSPPMNNNKGKLDSIKEEIKMEIKQEPEEPQNHRMDGKSVNNEINIKTEPKTEPMEEGSNEATVKEEPGIKEESMTPVSSQDTTASDIKPLVPEPIQPSGTSADKKKCLFKPDELRQALMPTLEKLYRQDPESIPFRQPVDPQALGIPDYPTIVKKPMDLSTIKKKLDTEKYSDPWEYVDDVWMMFDNAWLYNRKTSRVYRYCTKVMFT